MDTKPGSTLLSADYQVPTTGDLSKMLVLSESNEQSNGKQMSNINITEFLDAAVAGLNPAEARFQNVKSNSCQIIPLSESDDFDLEEFLILDSLTTDEEIPLEMELSLLEYDSEDSGHQKDAHYSTNDISVASDLSSSTAGVSPSTSSNLDTNNNLSCINQTLTGSDDRTFGLEDKAKPEAHIRVQSDHKVSKSVSPKRNVLEEGQGFSCGHPSKKILDGSPYSTKANLNGHSNSIQNYAILNSNILATNSKSSDDSDFRDHTVNGESVWSESPHKSKQKSTDFSKTLILEISEIFKDCNDNILDLEFGNEILSLEPPDVKESVETLTDSVKSDLSDSQWDSHSDPSSFEPCIASESQDGSSLIFQLDLRDQNQQSDQKDNSHSCSPLKSRNSPSFVPADDFERKKIDNKECKVMPQTLLMMTTFDGDRIKVLSDETVTSPDHNHIRTAVQVSPGVKSQPTDEEKILKRTQQFDINVEPGKCSSQCEDSVSIRDPKDQSKTDKATVSTPIETPIELSGDSLAAKPHSLGVKEQSTEQPLMKDNGRALTNSSNILKVNPGNLLKSSNPELIALTCQDSVPSARDSWLTDCQNEIIQKIHPSVKKPLKNNLEGKSSQVDNQFGNSNDKAPPTSSGQAPPTSSGQAPPTSSGQAPPTSSGQAPPTSSGQAPPTSSGQAPPTSSGQAPPTSSGQASLTSNKSKQHSGKNCSKDFQEEPEGSLESISESSSTKNLVNQKVREESLIVISVNNNSNQKRIVKLENQSKRGENSSITLRNRQVFVKSALNEDNQSMTGKSTFGQELQIKKIQDSDKSCTNLSGIDYILKDIVEPEDASKNSNNNNSKPVATTNQITGAMPAKVSLVAHSQLTEKNTPRKKTKSGSIPQKSSVQPSNVPQGVTKCKKSKRSKKRAKTLISLSKMGNLSSQTLMETVNTHHVPTKCKTQICSATSGNMPKVASSSSSLWEQTHTQDDVKVTAEDPTSKRKFVKAKRVLDKQKQLSALLEGEDCLDECKINDRVQWVCHRWNVKTLSNQDINLTTSAYIRRQLPTQEAACFQGCLEGQKDYTLAIVAPNRKRRLYEDDDNSTGAYDSLGHVTKKRRLSQDVQLIPDNVKDLQPNLKLFSNQLKEKLAASQNMSLVALDRQRKQELNLIDEQYRFLQCQLQEKQFQEKQFQEQQFYGYFGHHSGYISMYQLQSEHDYQQQQLDFAMHSKCNDLTRRFAEEEERLRTQYKTSVEKIKTVLSEDVSDSGCLTIALRKGPSRVNNYKIKYQTVSLTPHVALAMIREDEIYDSFYSHKV